MDSLGMFYGGPFVTGFIIASLLCAVIIYISKKYRVIDSRKGERHIHTKVISRFGGIAIIFATIISIFINQNLFIDKLVWTIIIVGVIILFIGIIDDIKPMSWMSQIFAQVTMILFTFIMGIRIDFITNPFGGVIWLANGDFVIGSFLFMLVWILVIMNAVNWSDGIDGLASGVIFIAAITLFIISLQPHINQPPIAILAIILAGSVFGFWIFNFPPAKIFAGSSGSFFMGYIIAILAIAAGAKIGTTILVLVVPLIDAVWVTLNRIYRGKSIFRGDSNHLHHRLLSRGWSVKKILILYYGITIACAIIAITSNSVGKIISGIIVSVVILLFFVFLTYDRTKKYSV